MSLQKKYDDLIDLKDHCFLCYRSTNDTKRETARRNSDGSETSHSSVEGDDGGKVDVKKVSEDGQKETLSSSSSLSTKSCKSFLTSIGRYLRIPYALVNIAIPGDNEPKTIRKRWENLIKGDVCDRCKPMVDHFRDLYNQYTYLKLQIDLVAQDIEQSIYLADKKRSSQDGKKMLESKWEMERDVVNPKLNFILLSTLRDHITTKAAKKNTLPYVRLRRMLSPVRRDSHPEGSTDVDADADETQSRSTRATTGSCQRHRPSLNEDSGFSTTTSENGLSPVSSVTFEMDRQFRNTISGDTSQQVNDPMNTTAQISGKEHVVIRQVIRCKKCNLKIMKEKFNEHCQSKHPKPTGKSSASATDSTANPSPNCKEGTDKAFRIKKTAIICPKDDCTGKSIEKEPFLNHLGLYQRELLPKFSSDHTTAIPKAVPKNNDKNSDIIPISKEVAPSSPVITPAPNPATTIEPKPHDKSVIKQGLGQNEAKATNSRRGAIRGPYLKRKFTCATCLRKFHTKHDLCVHAQTHLLHQCHFCNEVCESTNSIALHELHCHGDFRTAHPIPFGCPRCEQKFQNANTYKSHFWRTHLNKPLSSFKCFRCQETFESLEVFKEHDSLKACKSTPASPSLKNSDHSRKVAVTAEPQPGPSKRVKKDDFVCSICNLQCSSFFALKSHVISHDPNIEPCSDCPRLFKDKAQLEKHRNNYHIPDVELAAEPAPTPAPALGIKIVIIRKFCKYCNSRKTFKSVRSFEKHISKHEDKPFVRKKRRQINFRKQDKECPVCKKFFRNLGSHMKAHAIQPSQEEEAEEGSRENEEPQNNINDDTCLEEESEEPLHNELAVRMEVDPELISTADGDGEDELSTKKSLADRVKLRQRRPSCHSTVPVEFQLENSEDEDDYFPTQRGRKRSLSRSVSSRSRSRISRCGRNDTNADDVNDDDSVTERNTSKPITVIEAPPITAPENEDEEINVENIDSVPNKEGDNTRQPLININSTIPPRSESKVGKTSNKDDQCELARQSAILVNSSLPPKKRPQPVASLTTSLSDELEDTDDSSCSTVILTHGNRPKTANSTIIQVSSSDTPANNVAVQETEKSPRKQMDLSSTGIKAEPPDCVPDGNAKVCTWIKTSNAVAISDKTQEGDEDIIIIDDTTDKVVDKKPDVKVGENFMTPLLSKRVSTFLNGLNFQTAMPSPNIATNIAQNIPLSSVQPPTINVAKNIAENATSPPSPEVITID